MPQHLVAAEVHAITSFHSPSMVETIVPLNQETYVMMLLGEWLTICSPSLLVSNQGTIAKSFRRLTVETKMISNESIVHDLYLSIIIIDWGAITRVTDYLPPMLPARESTMIIVIICSGKMVWNINGSVVIVRTTLLFGIEILHHHITQPLAVLEVQLRTQHDILE